MVTFKPFNRNNVSLNVGNTDGSNGNYYDQICAMSEKTINDNFTELFNQRPDLKQITFRNPAEFGGGTLAASLKPPQVRVMFDNDTLPVFYYEIHIDKGDIRWSPQRFQNLNNWIITVRATVADDAVTGKTDDDDLKDSRAAQLGELKKSFIINEADTKLKAGDYSIQRLFVAFSEATWTAPLDDYTFVPDSNEPDNPAKRQTLRAWSKKGQASDDWKVRLRALDVTKVLGNWAAARQHTAYFTLGVQVRLPKEENEAERQTATCAPTDLTLQTYPWFTDEEQTKQLGPQGDGQLQGIIGKPYNCIVYCETVKDGEKTRRLPQIRNLNYRGNLAGPPLSGKPDDIGIPGTFVLDHRLYLEKRILKYLRELCVATNVIPLQPKLFLWERKQQFSSRIIVGKNAPVEEGQSLYPGLTNQSADNDFFAFHFAGIDDQGISKYSWSTTVHAPGSEKDTYEYRAGECEGGPVWRRWSIKSDNSVDVTWKAGEDTLWVSGKAHYTHWEAYSSTSSKFDWRSGKDCLTGSFDVYVDWKFGVDLSVSDASIKNPKIDNGVIEPTLVGLQADKTPKVNVKKDGGQFVLDGTDGKLKKQIEDNIVLATKTITSNLTAAFKGSGRFIYPGTRTLVFGPPVLNDYGDVIATVSYQPLGKDLVKIITPDLNEIVQVDPQPGKVVVTDPLITPNLPHINWSLSKVASYSSTAKRAVIILEGRNVTESPFKFESIQVTTLLNKQKAGIYYREDWISKPEPKPIKKPSLGDQLKNLLGLGGPSAQKAEQPQVPPTGQSQQVPPTASTSQILKGDLQTISGGSVAAPIVKTSNTEPKADLEATPDASTPSISKNATGSPDWMDEDTNASTGGTNPSQGSGLPTGEAAKNAVPPVQTGPSEHGAPGNEPANPETLQPSTQPGIGQDKGSDQVPLEGQKAEDSKLNQPPAKGLGEGSGKQSEGPLKPGPKKDGTGESSGNVPPKDESEDEPEDKAPVPTETYHLTQDLISTAIKVTFSMPDYSNHLFEIVPDLKGKKAVSPSFTMLPGAFIKLELDGATSKDGVYIIQITEYCFDPAKKEGDSVMADTFLKVTLSPTGGQLDVILLEEAKQIMGA